MKIIELLNKIANGNIPKKIKINNRIWEHDGIDYTRDSDGENLFNVFLETTTHDLNMEVEIIEEEKKIPLKINKIVPSQNYVISDSKNNSVDERLEKEQLITNMAYETVLNFYKSRNEKAIDLIKNHREELYEINGTQVEIKFQNIVNILNGDDE